MIENNLLYFKKQATYDTKKPEIKPESITFIEDNNIINTHGINFYCGKEPVALKKDLENFNVLGKPGTTGTNSEIFNDYDTNKATANYAHAEGSNNESLGECSHTEGCANKTSDFIAAHAEGCYTNSLGPASHSEGFCTTASGGGSHAEGYSFNGIPSSFNNKTLDKATNEDVIIEYNKKSFVLANKNGSHVEGTDCLALGEYSHSEGEGVFTKNKSEHAQGKFNHSIINVTIDSTGIGTSNNDRKNAELTTIDGKKYILGIGGYKGNALKSTLGYDYDQLKDALDLATVINNLENRIKQLEQKSL